MGQWQTWQPKKAEEVTFKERPGDRKGGRHAGKPLCWRNSKEAGRGRQGPLPARGTQTRPGPQGTLTCPWLPAFIKDPSDRRSLVQEAAVSIFKLRFKKKFLCQEPNCFFFSLELPVRVYTTPSLRTYNIRLTPLPYDSPLDC